MQTLPAIIKKHWIGYVAIVGIGLATTALLWGLVYSLHRSGDLSPEAGWMLYFASVVVLAVTIIQTWVYSLSYVELTVEGLHVVNWRTLFWKVDTTTEWERVQDVTVTTTSLFSLMFAYGTLLIQTAGTQQNLTLTMIPEPEYWQAIIQGLADGATP